MNTHTIQFISFPPSPWSEKAQWALDYCQVPYQKIIYTPITSTLSTRLKSKNLFGKFTTPVLIDGEQILRDSFDIAKYANNRRAAGIPSLFPKDQLNEIEQWNTLSENLTGIRRAQAMPLMKANKDLLETNLPPFIPQALRPHLTSVAKFALNVLQFKYRLPKVDHTPELNEGLIKLRDALKKNDKTVLGTFSYADITMTATIQSFKPVDTQYVGLDPATEACWCEAELIKDFKDLVEWRDHLYAQHRHPHTSNEETFSKVVAS